MRFYSVHCYVHGSNENNLRARLEDLIETEKKRAGKDFSRSDYAMKFSDGSKLLHGAIMVMRILGWAWRWAEWWVQFGSTWEPLLEPGQEESKMTARELRIFESSKESRMKDARKCRLAAFGAALRNRNYDTDEGYNTKALERALRAVLHTKSLVGPLEKHEIAFFIDVLARAYRSKSRLLGYGEDRIPVDEAFSAHVEDGSPKFELGDRPLPGKSDLSPGQVFEDLVFEPDDYLKYRKNENGEEVDTTLYTEIDYKYKGTLVDVSSEDSDQEITGSQVGETNRLPAVIDPNLLDKDRSYILKQRRGRIPKVMKLSIIIKIDGHSIPNDIGDQGAENSRSQKKQKTDEESKTKQPTNLKILESMMKFDQKGFGPLRALKKEFLVHVGLKSCDEFMKIGTKEITKQYCDWRVLKDLPPLKDSQSAGNTLNKWKSDVRKYYSQFIGNEESAPEKTMPASNEAKGVDSNHMEAIGSSPSAGVETTETVPVTDTEKKKPTDEGIESAISSKRSRRESSTSDGAENTRPTRRSRREFGNQTSAIDSEKVPSDEIGNDREVASRTNRSRSSTARKHSDPPAEASQGEVETLETRYSPRKTMDYRKGMYREPDDDVIDIDSETEIVNPKKKTHGRRRKSQTTAKHYPDTTDSNRDSKPLVKPIQKKKKPGRPPNLLKSLPDEGIDFIKMFDIKSVEEFVSTTTYDLAKSYVEFRKKTGKSVLKTTGPRSRISTWKRLVRDAAKAVGNTEVAAMGLYGQGTRNTESDNETDGNEEDDRNENDDNENVENDEMVEDDDGDDNDECEVCGKRGDLLICDGCDKSYHLHCVDLKEVPEGDWFCPVCTDTDKCVICNDGGTLILCDGCEKSYHVECAGLSEIPEGDWFCSTCDDKK